MKVAYCKLLVWPGFRSGISVAFTFFLFITAQAQSQDRLSCPAAIAGAPTAYIDSNASDVVVVTAGGQQLAASRDLLLCPGDEVRTGATGRVAIRFDEKRTVVRLDGNSRMRVLAGGAGTADASLMSGVLHFLSSVRRRFEVETPYIVAGIDGTEALVNVRPGQQLAIAAVREGIVGVYDRILGTESLLSVGAGEAAFRSATVRFQSAPIDELPEPFRSLLIVSDSAVDWAVYYPPIMFVESTRSRAVAEAIALLSSGDYDRALVALHAANTLAPEETYSLQTIIAVARNRLDEAEGWSRRALDANPAFPPAYIAASYVRQAEGNLDEALAEAAAAAELAPDDAYVTARLAELYMIVGNRRAALRTAEQSLAIRRTPLALFVDGLARLAAWQYGNAEALFNEAIGIDPEAPLPRLGLGLAYIRQGRTSAGAWEIERAAAHDPKSAQLRIWLGRAYFDEGLPAKAAEQFEVAKQEDPADPTSYLFSAMERYAANDPIGALRELQVAEELGGARRVIRSERGLNEDSATRGAAIARVFDVLGFDQLAVQEGARATDADPANAGAHRFMADAYRQRPELGVSQSSEILQSQLLSPPSMTPVQPELSEADLALLDTSGPSRVTFAEFSPLFDSDGVRVDLSGLGGTQHTWGDQVAVTGLYKNVSLSLGQMHYETDGYRRNNDLETDIYNAVTTIALSPEFSLFGEYRHRESEGGDRLVDFDISEFVASYRTELTREVARVGFHAQPSVEHDIIGVYSSANLDTGEKVEFIPGTGIFDFRTRVDDAHNIQLQHIWQDGYFRNILGGIYVDNDVREEFSIFGGFITGLDSYSTDYYSIYDYFYVDYPDKFTVTLGGSVVGFKTKDADPGTVVFDVFEFLPKIGVEANITDAVTIRAAYLKNLKPELVSEQVLEPTEIVGFTQYYDALNTSILEQAGVGLDIELFRNVFLGGESVYQWWQVPFVGIADRKTDERVNRLYFYATLWDEFALSAELIDERSESNDVINDFADWRTTSVPVSLSYFNPNGIFASAGLEYVNHSVLDLGVRKRDQFTLVNGSIGIRFPNSAGIFVVEGQNLLDEHFNFQNRIRRPDIAAVPRYAPARTVTVRGILTF